MIWLTPCGQDLGATSLTLICATPNGGRTLVFNIRTELPSGAISIGYERPTADKANTTFDRVVAQCREMKKYTIDVILSEDGVELKRDHISNA
jgi:hypothetical protein